MLQNNTFLKIVILISYTLYEKIVYDRVCSLLYTKENKMGFRLIRLFCELTQPNLTYPNITKPNLT